MPEASVSNPFGARRYRAWNDEVRLRHGGRVQKVSVQAATTCPNRDGTLGRGGCTFCNNAGFTPSYLRGQPSVTAQIDTGLAFLRRRYPGTRHFIAYFQSYTNTHGDLDALCRAYDEALAHPAISGLAIGTRPDCLAHPVLERLQAYATRGLLELEIGVESTDDAALVRVNRGHGWACSVDAIERAHAAGLAVTAHLILGLPGESRASMLTGAERLSALPVAALKLHQLQIVRGTALARQWRADPASVPLLDESGYLELLADFVERLSPAISLQRLGSEVPPALKLAPSWNLRLPELAPRLSALLAERGSWQGCRAAAAPAAATGADLTPRRPSSPAPPAPAAR